MKYTLSFFTKDAEVLRCFSINAGEFATLPEARRAAWIRGELPRAQAYSVLIEAEDGSSESWLRDGLTWKKQNC